MFAVRTARFLLPPKEAYAPLNIYADLKLDSRAQLAPSVFMSEPNLPKNPFIWEEDLEGRGRGTNDRGRVAIF